MSRRQNLPFTEEELDILFELALGQLAYNLRESGEKLDLDDSVLQDLRVKLEVYMDKVEKRKGK